jgi:hypothetical protein
MPFTFELAAFGWHATIFVSWGSLAVLALLVTVAVVGARLLVTNAG